MADTIPLTDEMLAAGRSWLPSYQVLVHRTDMGEWAKPANHHKEMIRALNSDDLDVAIVAPRDSAKTTLAQSYIEWTIGRASLSGERDWANKLRILYLRHAEDLAGQVSDAIRDTIEFNEVYHKLFPGVLKSEKWSQSVWRIKGSKDKDPTFTCGGIKAPPLGGRFSLGIFDDIADDNNMATDGERLKIKRKLDGTVMFMRVPKGKVRILGTRWHIDDVIQWAEDNDFTIHTWKALIEQEDGSYTSWWPERYPVELLLKEREQKPRWFSLMRQNEATPSEGLTFERWWFADKRFDMVPPADFYFESWDTASTIGRKSDYTAVCAFAVTQFCPLPACNGAPWHAFVLHMQHFKLLPAYVKQSMRDLYMRMGGHAPNHWIVVERKDLGVQLASEGLHVQGDSRIFPLHARSAMGEGQAKGTKDGNIRDVAQICLQGRVHLPSEDYVKRLHGEADNLYQFENALFAYEPSQQHTDDFVVAFCQGVMEMEEQRHQWERQRNRPLENIKYALPQGEKVQV